MRSLPCCGCVLDVALFNPEPFVRVFSRSAHNKTISSNFRLKTTLKLLRTFAYV